MKREMTDDLLSQMDAMLGSVPAVTCWRCEKARGEPSVCNGCKTASYERPPKGLSRVPWAEPLS